ncbi:hypothetical protein DXG03_000051 [Asterophora parasitica]|uniref:RGS domain-containing protein n=1 Tax=Asterophora parasitica TaxID=117018 RepID=A0A9P7KGJ4_9AGAR|nr:hypothetical protein DXG03_000051 [Asterophora parasitica]
MDALAIVANVLAGDTCAPISLADFEKHLTFIEYSVENLQFVVWFQDYRERYFKSHAQASPAREEFAFSSPNSAKTERQAEESLARLDQARIEESKEPPSPNPTSPSPLLPPHYSPLALPPLTHTVSTNSDSETQRLNTECQRAVATFLSPGSSKELLLDATVRDTVIRNLSLDCHPDVFLPAYEEIYNLVERCSLPRFLSLASANINLPKQIYWYAVGIINIVIGVFLALILIMRLPTPPQANRAWRIFPVGFCSLGAGQCYSAWRGYCSQVWMRGNTQLRVWEMQDMDVEAKAFVNRILDPHTMRPPYECEDRSEKATKHIVASIAPFSVEPLAHSSDTIASSYGSGTGHSDSARHFHRPPVFGPEAVVLDPRIKAVHRQVMIDTCRFGLFFMVVFSALIFSVPSHLQS